MPGSNTGDEHLYYCQDANYNVTALVEDYDGEAVERYMYSPYGEVTVLHGVRDASGSDTSADEWDPRDAADSFANEILYCGYYHDWETGLYHVRNRYYHPPLGRWTSRDPIGYVDGMGLYEYAIGNPIGRLDFWGLAASFYDCERWARDYGWLQMKRKRRRRQRFEDRLTSERNMQRLKSKVSALSDRRNAIERSLWPGGAHDNAQYDAEDSIDRANN